MADWTSLQKPDPDTPWGWNKYAYIHYTLAFKDHSRVKADGVEVSLLQGLHAICLMGLGHALTRTPTPLRPNAHPLDPPILAVHTYSTWPARQMFVRERVVKVCRKTIVSHSVYIYRWHERLWAKHMSLAPLCAICVHSKCDIFHPISRKNAKVERSPKPQHCIASLSACGQLPEDTLKEQPNST